MLLLLAACSGSPGLVHDAPGTDDTDLADSGDSGDTDSGDSHGDTDDTGPPPDTGGTPHPCDRLTPTGDPDLDLAALTTCLADGHAGLAAGTFVVRSGFDVPAGASLEGVDTARSTVQLAGSSVNHVISLGTGSVARHLVLDAADHLPSGANEAVVHVTGNGALLEDAELTSSVALTRGVHAVGVYFIDSTSSGALVRTTTIHGLFYGAIFVAGLDSAHANVLSTVDVYDIRCDGVTFAGYGVLSASHVHEAGYDCENGPIPGASVYGLANDAGALIDSNELDDDCGNVVDLDTVSHFVLTNNHVHDPGNQWGGAYPWCGEGAGMGIIDSHDLWIEGNTVENNDRPQNRMVSDPNGVFSSYGSAGGTDDLPHGSSNVLAFWLGRREGGSAVTGNVITGNAFRSACTSGCVGVGYFLSRSTGLDVYGNWSAYTTNYLTANDPMGSNVGSVRCGANWYAADSTCDGHTMDADCNTDDDQHTYDWSRNDDCRDYR